MKENWLRAANYRDSVRVNVECLYCPPCQSSRAIDHLPCIVRSRHRCDSDDEVATELCAWLQLGPLRDCWYVSDARPAAADSAWIICRKWKINCISGADHDCCQHRVRCCCCVSFFHLRADVMVTWRLVGHLDSRWKRSCNVECSSIVTSPAAAIAKYCDEYVCLCVSVREDFSGTTRAIFTNFCVAYVRGSVFLRRWQ